MDLVSLFPTTFQLSPFSLGSFCLDSNGAVGGGCCVKGTICNDLLSLQKTAAGGLGSCKPERIQDRVMSPFSLRVYHHPVNSTMCSFK